MGEWGLAFVILHNAIKKTQSSQSDDQDVSFEKLFLADLEMLPQK
jgi:hypothetical protein